MKIFDDKNCISVCVKNTNKYVSLAVNDMINDFMRVSSRGVSPQIINQENDFCIVIEENTSLSSEPLKDESFKIKSDGNKIRIIADGYLGTMWGIYTFCEKYLGVDPCYLFNDMEIQKVECIDVPDIDIEDKPEGFGFRGVFINDEDLLTGWRNGGGIRYLDYIFYGVTVEESVIKMVIETVLRLKLNLVIPASFLDIDNPPEKLLADCVAERGIYVSQHHLEPLGLSAYTFKNYCKKYNKEGEFSYKLSPEVMEEAWEFYAKKWAEYDNVVWQIGLRGEGDRPVWQDEVPTENDFLEAGEFISRAYLKEKEIVLKVTDGKAKYFTSTLWMEGSALMEKGYLNIPEDVTIVFADAGPNQMYGNEYERVPRINDLTYGIYYHLQYYGCGPHFAPQTGLDKLYYNLSTAYNKGDSSYIILNTSNIREFVFELGAYSQMTWNMREYSNEKYLDEYCEAFGLYAKEMKKLVSDYFDKLPSIEAKHLDKHLSKYFNYCKDDSVENVKNFVLKEGMILARGGSLNYGMRREIDPDGLFEEFYNELKRVLPEYKKICDGFDAVINKIEEPYKKHIQVKWSLYAKTLYSIYNWYVYLYEARECYHAFKGDEMKELLTDACKSLEDYLNYRKCAEYGVFENWYRGELKMNIKQHLQSTKRQLGHTLGYDI